MFVASADSISIVCCTGETVGREKISAQRGRKNMTGFHIRLYLSTHEKDHILYDIISGTSRRFG
jgi:hypothetical protein